MDGGSLPPPPPTRPYHGPGDTGRSGGSPSGPSTPAPAGPASPLGAGPGPATPAGPMHPDDPRLGPSTQPPTEVESEAFLARWQRWWQFNRDAYIDLGGPASGLESTSGVALRSPECRAEVRGALEKVLVEGGHPAVVCAALIALARMDAERQETSLSESFAQVHLAIGRPEVKESALLALGVAGSVRSVPLLRQVLLDQEEGRSALRLGAEAVGPRQRAFAAFALGMIGNRARDAQLRVDVVAALVGALSGEHDATRELQVACALAAGLVPLASCSQSAPEGHCPDDACHLCGDVQLGDRLQICLARGDVRLRSSLRVCRSRSLAPALRAHAATSIARLGAQASEAQRGRVLMALADASELRSREATCVRQGCAIGLGLLADGDRD